MSATNRSTRTGATIVPHDSDGERPARRRGAAAAATGAFRLLAAAFTVGVVVQVFLAGLGVFGTDGAALDQASSLDAHRSWGDVLGVAAVILFLLGLLARVPRRLLAATFTLAALTEIAQHGLAEAGLHHSWAGGLHAVDGALILLLGTYVAYAASSGPEDTA